MNAIAGTPVRMKTMANGNIRLEIEFEEKDLMNVAQISSPSLTLAVVPITPEAAKDAQIKEAVKDSRLAQNAARLCREPAFRLYVGGKLHGMYLEATETAAAEYLREYCGITSRAELDHNPEAAERFEQLKKAYYGDQL